MPQRNVAREIAIILVTTVVLGGAFAFYLMESIEEPTPIALSPSAMDQPEGVAGADDNADALRTLATAFGRHLSTHDYAAAHQSMAAPMRDATTAEQLAAMVAKNAYLAGAQSITLLRTTEQRAGNDPSTATLRGVGVLSSSAGAVEITLHFVREPDGLRIVSVLLAGVPVLQAVEAAPLPTGTSDRQPRSP